MSAVAPHIAAVYAAILGILAALLTVRVIVARVRTGVSVGDGGDACSAGRSGRTAISPSTRRSPSC